MSEPAPGLLDDVRQFCATRQMEPLDLLERLGERLEEILPPGCRIAQCGSCKRRSAVPSGKALRGLRIAHGFSQDDVAKAAGCTKQHVCGIEKERCQPVPAVVAAYERLAAEAVASTAE